MFNGKAMVPSMITNIGNFEPRNDFIVKIIEDILEKEPERCILILSDRIAHLKILKEKIEAKGLPRTGLFIGKMKQVELDYSADNSQILLASFSIASEGLDLYKLDTLILATSKNNVIQSVGRILRKKPEDRTYTPLVVDIIDQFSVFPNQFKKRMKYYKSNNFDIVQGGEDTVIKKEKEEITLKKFAFINL
jgi:superfamily II DNA or RNA helicase